MVFFRKSENNWKDVTSTNFTLVLSLQQRNYLLDVKLFGSREKLILKVIEENSFIKLDSLLTKHVKRSCIFCLSCFFQ